MTGEIVRSPSVRLHTAGEVAASLQCKESWIKKKAQLREIPFSMISGEYRFSDRHIEEIIKLFEQQPQDRQPPRSRKRRTAPASAETAVHRQAAPLKARRPRRAVT